MCNNVYKSITYIEFQILSIWLSLVFVIVVVVVVDIVYRSKFNDTKLSVAGIYNIHVLCLKVCVFDPGDFY